MRKRCDLKKKLRVTFVGEAGLDMGGLTKEWFLLLVRQIFHTDYGETHLQLTGVRVQAISVSVRPLWSTADHVTITNQPISVL